MAKANHRRSRIRGWRAADAGGPRGRWHDLLAAEAIFAPDSCAAPRLAAALRRERARMRGLDYDCTRHWVLSRALALLAGRQPRPAPPGTTKAPPGEG